MVNFKQYMTTNMPYLATFAMWYHFFIFLGKLESTPLALKKLDVELTYFNILTAHLGFWLFGSLLTFMSSVVVAVISYLFLRKTLGKGDNDESED